MPPRVCVYSVLVGGYEKLLEQPVARSSDYDFILFTDDRDLTSETWQIRTEELILPQDPARSSRYAKLLPHRALPGHDVSIYIDNSLLLREPPEIILADLLPDDSVFVLNAHDFRETVRDEFEAVVAGELDAPWVCAEQMEHYESWHPEVLQGKPLWSGFMIRRHRDPLLIRTMELWWTQLLRYSRRDQLSLTMALRETGLEPTILSLDSRASRYHEWPQVLGRVRARGGKLPGMSELTDCREELDQANERWAIASQWATDIEGDRNDLRVEVDGLRQGIADRDHVLRLMHDSRSWQITEPLRWLGDRARRRS